MTALAALGLAEAIRDVAYQTGTAGMQDTAGRWIMRLGCDVGGGWRQPVRNAIFRRLPAASLVKAGAPVVRWTAPSQPG